MPQATKAKQPAEKTFRIIIAASDGTVIDYYDDVTAADMTSRVFSPEILNWMRRTIERAP